jgi:hypothetical protein
MIVTDEMINTFNSNFMVNGEEGKGHIQSIRSGIEAVIPIIERAAYERAALAASGAEYQKNAKGEITIRGTDKASWEYPTETFPRVDGYGQGRHDAAAAISKLLP